MVGHVSILAAMNRRELMRLLEPLDTPRNRVLAGVAGGLLVLSLALTCMLRPSTEVDRSEYRAAIQDRSYRVRCDACRARSDIAAADFDSGLDIQTSTVECPKCGKGRAKKIGQTLHPKQVEFEAEADAMTVLADVQAVMNGVSDESRALREKLEAAQTANDQAAIKTLTEQQTLLRAKNAAFHARWDELALTQPNTGE